MSGDSSSVRTGVLEKWSKVFDKSNLSRTPRTLPYRDSTVGLEKLELEDVFEEVQEEVSSKGQHLTHSKHDDVIVPRRYQPRRRSNEIIRPKTPGRSGLHQEQSHFRTERPPWHSSTRISNQNKAEYETRQNALSDTLRKQDHPISKPRPPSGTKMVPKSKSPIQPETPSPATSSSPDVFDDKLPPKPITPALPISESPSLHTIPVLPLKPVVGGEPISQEIARDLRKVVFGSALTSFNSDWRTQHINFLRHSSYGISFYKPGPCGVISCIQAYLMKHLLYCQQTSIMTENVLEPLPSERQQALVSGMANIIWQAGSESHFAIVALPCGECKWSSRKDYRKDNVTENLVLFGFDNLPELEKFIKRHLSFFENTSGNGCIAFLYSVILSRTVKGVKADLANPVSILMGPNDTCSQAMINLLLTGRAVSHTFNGTVDYNKNGKALPFPLKGVKKRSEIGFLTINEHFKPKEYQVGSMLKTPKYPVWVVDSSGGRYSVVFCLNGELVNDWRLERRFNLHYYNGTTKYSSSIDEEIIVDTRDFLDETELTEDTHPVEHCIRTKWPGAVVEWL